MTVLEESDISGGWFLKCRANLGCFNITGTFSSLFKWNSPESNVSSQTAFLLLLVQCYCILLMERNFSIKVCSQRFLLLTQVGTRLKILQMEDLLWITGRKKKKDKMLFGGKFWYKLFCANTALSRQWKLGLINIFWTPKKERYPIKRIRNITMFVHVHRCIWTQPLRYCSRLL